MNMLYTTKSSPWEDGLTTEQLNELEYTQLDEAKGGGGNGNTNIPVNDGIVFVLLLAIIYGIWKQYRTSARSI